MKLIEKRVPSNWNLFLFGDDHEGTILRSDKGWEKFLDMMQSYYDGIPPRRNWGWHHGDFMEAIMIDDPRYDPHTVKTPIPMEQLEAAVKNLEPIKTRLVGISEGNHPLKLWKFGPMTEMLCGRLNVEYGTWASKVIWKDSKDRLMFKSFHTHGRKSINSAADDQERRESNMRLTLKRHLKEKMGDCVLMAKGHTHRILITKPKRQLFIADQGGKLVERYTKSNHTAEYIDPDHRWYVNTGSFLNLYGEDVSGYAEIGEYDPMEHGFAVARIRDRQIVGIDKVVV